MGKRTSKPPLPTLNPTNLRGDLIRSMSVDAISQAEQMMISLEQAQAALERYLSQMKNIQAQSVQRALAHFPTDRVLGRFAGIWLTTDPTHIKIMRRTGQVVEWPFKTLTFLVGRLRDQKKSKAKATADTTPEAQLDIDLLDAATYLYQQAAADHLEHGPAPSRRRRWCCPRRKNCAEKIGNAP